MGSPLSVIFLQSVIFARLWCIEQYLSRSDGVREFILQLLLDQYRDTGKIFLCVDY